MFEQAIKHYEEVRCEYEECIVKKMAPADYMDWHEVLFSTHSCAIEGNSFTVDDTRILKEQGLAMVPVGHSLLECTEMADHFRAFRYVTTHLDAAFDEKLLCETNRLVTENTLAYRAPGAVAGAYTTEDMAAGDTVFGDHETLVARVPALMSSTAEAMERGVHPMIVAARFHGFFEYLHPFRDGNGRTGRLLSNWILLHTGHPLLIIDIKDRADYINALRQIRSEGTDEYLVSFFFRVAVERMNSDLAQKRKNTGLGVFLF
ncbi:MAG: Fic family protein [Prevotella sp.]|nr:Fic family protein [Prevotella sp.]